MKPSKQATVLKSRRSRAEPDPLQMRVLSEITRHPGWDIEGLGRALGVGLSDVAFAVDALLVAGMLQERHAA